MDIWAQSLEFGPNPEYSPFWLG